MSSGYESNGYGMIELDGTVTDRAKIAGEFAGRHRAQQRRSSRRFARVPRASRSSITGCRTWSAATPSAPGTIVRNSMLGIYRALFEQNIQADFIHPDEIAGGRRVEVRRRVSELSADAAASGRRCAQGIRARRAARSSAKRVRRGTTNAAHANTRIPGGGLDEVFGAREKELRSPEAVTFTTRGTSTAPSRRLPAGPSTGVAFAEHLEVTGPIDARAGALPGGRKRSRGSGDRHVALRQRARDTDRDVSVGGLRAAPGQDARQRASCCSAWWPAPAIAPEIRIDGARGPRRSALARVIRRDAAHRHQSRGHAAEGHVLRSGPTFPRRSGRTWKAARR